VSLNEKEEGETLSKTALDSDAQIVQLRKLYDATKSMSLDDLEVFIKYQMSRIPGYWKFGDKALSVLNECKGDKLVFQRVLETAIKLYGYLGVKSFIDLKPKVSEIVKKMTYKFGFEDIDFSFEEDEKKITVVLSGFYGSPQEYASQIHRQILHSLPEASKHKFRVWIKGGR
jgi:hypothetical protein